MVRAPCCEKMGLKKGPWTPEEDQVLISFIQQNGHSNWRALPKQAGLLRCGKSCRLRWTNYLRPDIKRGNFTKEEEDSIIQLHEMLGNRWSAIAARLPGRTDNEIKNVWHTHLKKRLKDYKPPQNSKRQLKKNHDSNVHGTTKTLNNSETFSNIQEDINSPLTGPNSPQLSSSEMSSVTTTTNDDQTVIKLEEMDSYEDFPEIDESFWTEDLNLSSGDYSNFDMDMVGPKVEDDMDFWYNVFVKAGDLVELPEF